MMWQRIFTYFYIYDPHHPLTILSCKELDSCSIMSYCELKESHD